MARHAIPDCDKRGKVVLDIGCGTGEALALPDFAEAAELHGIDYDAMLIDAGKVRYPKLKLQVAMAEKLPFANDSVDIVMSRVAIPYTHIPTALKEIHRVLKPNGVVYLTLHDHREIWRKIKVIPKDREIKPVLDLVYMLVASAIFNLTGWQMARPWNGTYQSLQSTRRMRKLMRKHFDVVMQGDTREHFIMEAVKP